MTAHAARHQPQSTHELWIGDLTLDLRHGRDWAAAQAELTLALDTMTVRVLGRELAVIVRDRFRTWLDIPHPAPYKTDDILWTSQNRRVRLDFGPWTYTVTTESRDCLRRCL